VLLETLLRSKGYLTLSAANGEEALVSIAQHAPDLILLDIMMPRMDGNEVARRLKANPTTANIPIIIVTVQIDRTARLAGLNAGAEDFLTKPIDRDELWLKVRNLLRLKELGDFHRNHISTLAQEVQARTADLKHFRAAMDVSPDSIYLTDPVTMRFVYLNDTACQRLGYTREQLLEMGPQDVLTVGREQVSRTYNDVIAAGDQGVIHESPFVRSDGSKGWTELHRRALRTADGTLIVTIGRDISDRRQAEERFRRYFQLGLVGMAITAPDKGFLEVNDKLCEILGYARSELLKLDWADLTHPDDVAVDTALLKRVLAGEIDKYEVDKRWIRKDGQVIDSSIAVSCVRRSDGSVNYVLGLLQDITERKQAEERIRRLNRVYAVLSGINSAIVRIRSREELFSEACQIAVTAGGFAVARVIALDSNGTARLAATAGDDTRLIQLIINEYNGNPAGCQNFLALALRSEQPMVSNDVANDLRLPNREALTKEGNFALALFPIIVEKRVAGVFLLRSRDAGMFDDEELTLLRELVSDISFALDHISKEERLNYLAMYDPLTGLANRTLFLERLNQFIQATIPTGNKIALVLADIERFRTINESLGRTAGDAVIKQLAERFVREVGKAEVARIGADHFAIVLQLQAIKGKSEITRRIDKLWRTCLAEPFRVLGAELRISAKAGATLFPNDGSESELLLRNAEAAIEKAKELGERCVFYTSALTARTGEKLTLENQLRQALEKNEFVLHYQPKVDVETRRIVGVEALIRWQSPELGLVPPMKFIPLMEETGLILDVGAWALDKAIEDHFKWIKLGLTAPRVAVNVSAIQLRRRDFVFIVEDALTRGATPPGVDLEITESLVMEDIQSNMQKLKDVRALGLSIAIDDFGTGYSSLGYLAKLPVQTLKIDRSFIITMLKDPATMTLVQTIISLAHSLRLKVVAEGVDEEEQAKVLRLLRCDEMQGYLFSRPVPFDQMTKLLADGTVIAQAAPAG
jgi:PAS domain S-box-containing protein/diguanylate cyclase (GGDEF)-like protein